MSKTEITRQFDAIVDFSGTEKFLDTPVKRYSSGMYVRLAFAVAAHLNPEILIIDEVLAVGDSEFQKKCLGKMKDVADSGRTVLFVSHHLQSVAALCKNVMLMRSGHKEYFGDVSSGIQQYVNALQVTTNPKDDSVRREGSGELRFVAVATTKASYDCGEQKVIQYALERFTNSDAGKYYVSCHIVNDDNAVVLHLDSRLVGDWFDSNANHEGEFTIKQPWLKPGSYRVDMFICSNGIIDKFESACQLQVDPVFSISRNV